LLFDLRSKGRRRTMQVIYIGLAILLAAGLVLFGIGTGTGGGGLLGGLSGSGSSNNQAGAVGKVAQQAQARVTKNPNDPAAWAALIQARYENAQSAGIVNGAFTNFGKQQLALVANEYQQYVKLVPKPDVTTATFAARAYSYLANYAEEAQVWDQITAQSPTAVGYKCLAVSAYAAKNTRLAELAQAKLLSKVPKSQRKTLAAELQSATTSPKTAQGC
jgi:hypothetical protein